MKPLYERQSLCFSCSACGDCCSTGDDYYVYLTDGEAERIRNYLGLSKGWFMRRYLERLEDGELVATSAADGRCIFLDANKQCKVYAVRPLQCRTEGVNCGLAVPVERIRRSVKACLDQESCSPEEVRPGTGREAGLGHRA